MRAVRIQNRSVRRLMVGGLAAALGATALVAPAWAAPQPPAGGTGAAAEAERAAATAARTGRRVEVLAARTELTQVFAKPSGGFVAESAAVPQRVRRADGSWADIDLTLRRDGADGFRPAVSPADVRFSAGGHGPATTLTSGGRSLTLSWPHALPAPVVSGDAATYPEVLPGVDLVLRATRTGFTHVLAVKTAQAAANPALREIRFDLGGDVRVRRDADGSLRAHAGAVEVARSAPAEMWDSASATGRSAAGRSSAAGPGAGARTAPVATAIDAAGDLVLRPTPRLLDPARAAFPVYIDPAWSSGASRWAYATNNNSNNSDLSAARVGMDSVSGVVYRSYFEFPISALRGKHIESAYVQMRLDHSHSCGNTPTYMYQSVGMTSVPRVTWAPTLSTLRASAGSHANESGSCVDSPQPDMTVNFTGSGVTAGLSSALTSGMTAITYGFCACSDSSGTGESTPDRWKKFIPSNARLVVDYDSLPGQPTNLQTGGQECVAGGRVALSTAPTLSAVFPDADAGQTLQTTYELLEIPASGSYDSSTPRLTPPAGAAVTAGARSTTAPLTGVSGGRAYAWRVRGTDAAPYDMTSPWSQWCEFTVDDTAPTVTVDPVTDPAPPGQLHTYKVRSPDPDVVSFRYGWSSPPTEEAEAGTSLGYPGKTVSVTLTTPAYGTNTLYVAAVDSVGNVGYGSVVVQVDPPAAG
ncbi:hypothetical protein ACGF7U_24380 [Micromonospora sp. NPDC047670]|uniref:hypothetical protein n=1 Tax=Micromonospora sp. NPDC047670 TaxID=3364252 RepID=UPI003718F7F1